MTLGCVKNVSSLRERNSSQGSFLFYTDDKTPEAHGFEGIFYVKAPGLQVHTVVISEAHQILGLFILKLHIHGSKNSFRCICASVPTRRAYCGYGLSLQAQTVKVSKAHQILGQFILKLQIHGS
jgi:hypothetical protein